MGCICQECGREYGVDILVSDELWVRISPGKGDKLSGLLCGSCILLRIERLFDGDYAAFDLLLRR